VCNDQGSGPNRAVESPPDLHELNEALDPVLNAQDKRQARTQAFGTWQTVTNDAMLDRLAA